MSSSSVQPASAPQAALSKSAYRRLAIAAGFGSAIEQFDMMAYAILAPLVFDTVFFPKVDPHVGTLMVYATFFIGFLSRPVGGIVFGHYGDRMGRKSVLMITLLTMGVGSFFIGCLPSYAVIGIWAPIALVILRFLQGFAVGGEWMNAAVLAIENAPTKHRGFFASWVNAAGPVGVIGSSAFITWLGTHYSRAEFQAWAWRAPFLVSLLLVAVGTYMRSHVDESVLFTYAQKQAKIPRVPIAIVLRDYKKPWLFVVLINMVAGVYFYLTTIFMMGLAIRRLGMPQAGVTAGYMFGNILEFIMVLLLAHLSDRWGRRPLLLVGIAGSALFFPAIFKIMLLKNVFYLALGTTVSLGIFHALMFGPNAAFMAEQFPTEVRVSGSSFGQAFGTVIGGGIAPLAATSLMGRSLNFTPVYFYYWIVALCAFLGILMAKETYKEAL